MEAWTTKFWIAGLLACANIAVFEHFFTMFMPLVLLTGSTAALSAATQGSPWVG